MSSNISKILLKTSWLAVLSFCLLANDCGDGCPVNNVSSAEDANSDSESPTNGGGNGGKGNTGAGSKTTKPLSKEKYEQTLLENADKYITGGFSNKAKEAIEKLHSDMVDKEIQEGPYKGKTFLQAWCLRPTLTKDIASELIVKFLNNDNMAVDKTIFENRIEKLNTELETRLKEGYTFSQGFKMLLKAVYKHTPEQIKNISDNQYAMFAVFDALATSDGDPVWDILYDGDQKVRKAFASWMGSKGFDNFPEGKTWLIKLVDENLTFYNNPSLEDKKELWREAFNGLKISRGPKNAKDYLLGLVKGSPALEKTLNDILKDQQISDEIDKSEKELKAVYKAAQKNYDAVNEQEKLLPKAPKVSPKGIKNCGNTCYLNSVTQAIFHTPEMAKLLIAPEETLKAMLNKDYTWDKSLLKALSEVFKRYQNQEEASAVDPEPLIKARTDVLGFKSGSQEDGGEFLVKVLERLDLELSVKKDENQDIAESLPIASFTDRKNVENAKSYSLLDKWFGSFEELKTFWGQKEKAVSKFKYAQSQTIMLPLMETAKNQSLKSLFESYQKKEHNVQLDPDEIILTKNVERESAFITAPKILSVNLRRYSDKNEKISVPVMFDESFQLETTKEGNVSYSLYAISCHSGGTLGGHYYSYVKTKGKGWNLVNDSVTQPTTFDDILKKEQKNAYIFFFQREK